MRLAMKEVPGIRDMTDAQVMEASKTYSERAERDQRERAERERVEVLERERAEAGRLRSERMAALRERLAELGHDAAGLSDEEVEAKVEEVRRAVQRQAEGEMKRRRADSLFAASNCPARHVQHIEGLDDNRDWLRVRDALAGRAAEGYLVALLGKRGTGKTQLAVSVIRKACDRGLACRYVKALDLFREVRGTFTAVAKGRAGEREEDVVDALARPDVLVIDEAHQRAGTEFEQNTLTNLIDRRYDAMRSTVLIANLDKKSFAESIGDSVVSRINEAGEAIWCEWPSYRKPGIWLGNRGGGSGD